MGVTTVYQTEDNETFNTLEAAQQHQNKLDLWDKVLEKFGVYGEVKINYLTDFLEIIQFYEDNK